MLLCAYPKPDCDGKFSPVSCVNFSNLLFCFEGNTIPINGQEGPKNLGKNGQSVGAIEDTKLEELLEGTEDTKDEEDEEALNRQDKDHQAADEALMEEVVDTPGYTIDIDDAKENIRTGKLSMSKVHVPLPVIRSN